MLISEAVARNLAEGPARAARSHARRKALKSALTGGTAPPEITKAELGAAAARQAGRQALALARSCFDSAVGDNADALAAKLVELGLEGNPAVLLTICRTLQPPAKYDSTKIELDIGPIDNLEDIDRARRRLAEAVFAGRVGVEDGNALARMLDSLADGILRDQKSRLVNDMRAALTDTAKGGASAKVRLLTERAEMVLEGLRKAPEAPLIEAQAEPDDDTDESWRTLL